MNRTASTEELFPERGESANFGRVQVCSGVFQRDRVTTAPRPCYRIIANNRARTSGVRVSRHSAYTGLKMLLNEKLCSVLHVCVNHAWSRSRRGLASIGM